MINIKYIPNALTIIRIALSLVLLGLDNKSVVFVIIYALAGLSDAADGFIARRFRLETAIGAKLDSLADFVFTVVMAFVIFSRFVLETPIIIMLAVVFAVRAVNFIITKVKFRQWSMMHTIGNKATGFVLFLAVPIFVWLDRLWMPLVAVIGVLAVISSIEELAVLVVAKDYDVNRKSICSSK